MPNHLSGKKYLLMCLCYGWWHIGLFQYCNKYAQWSNFCSLFSSLLSPSLFRFKGLPPEDATWVCGRGFCQPARQQHSHGGWVSADQTPEGLVEGLGQGQCMLFCNMRRWEILTRPLPSLDWRPLPLTRGVCLCGQVYVSSWHTYTHISSTILPHLSFSILVNQSPSLSLSVSVG